MFLMYTYVVCRPGTGNSQAPPMREMTERVNLRRDMSLCRHKGSSTTFSLEGPTPTMGNVNTGGGESELQPPILSGNVRDEGGVPPRIRLPP